MVYLFTVNTYVPHYTKLTERKKHMDNEFKKLNIDNPIYVTDFDGDSLTEEDLKKYSKDEEYYKRAADVSLKKIGVNTDTCKREELHNSEISLVLKHFSALESFLYSDADYALLLEDDVECINQTSINDIIEMMPPEDIGCDVIILGGPLPGHFFDVSLICSNFFLVNHPATNTTCSILYTKSAAKKLKRAYDTYGFCLPLDWQLNYFFMMLDLKVWHYTPHKFRQLSGSDGKFQSSIQGANNESERNTPALQPDNPEQLLFQQMGEITGLPWK